MGNEIGVDVSGSVVRIACLVHSSLRENIINVSPHDFIVQLRDAHTSCATFYPGYSAALLQPWNMDSSQYGNLAFMENIKDQNIEAKLLETHSLDDSKKWKKPEGNSLEDLGVEGVIKYLEQNRAQLKIKQVFCFRCEVIQSKQQRNTTSVFYWYMPLESLPTALIKIENVNIRKLGITGSGCFYLVDLIQKNFPHIALKTNYHREISCILDAVHFLLRNSSEDIFKYETTSRAINEVLPDPKNYDESPLAEEDRNNFYPFLLVNLKAGASFHKVLSPGISERIGGSTIGGATVMGLLRLLADGCLGTDEVITLMESGDNSTCDMLVKDIYGGSYANVNLKPHVIASSMGKMQFVNLGHCSNVANNNGNSSNLEINNSNYCNSHAMTNIKCCYDNKNYMNCDDNYSLSINNNSSSNSYPNICETESNSKDLKLYNFDCYEENNYIRKASINDLGKSLLTMMSFNVAQLCYFHTIIHNIKRVALVGFMLDTPSFLASIQHSFNFWSNGKYKVHFFKSAPFLGALGASLRSRYS